jgi:TPR repeat protein
VAQDLVLALQWFALAAERGHAGAAAQRDEVAAGLSKADVDKALQRARDWRPSLPPQKN